MATVDQHPDTAIPNLEANQAKENRPRIKSLSALMLFIFRQVHLWLGLSFGVITAIAGLTGSALVFRPEIDKQI